MSATIAVPSLPTLEHEAAALAKVPVSFTITDQVSLELAGFEFRRASAFLKAVAAEFVTIDRAQIDARNATIALRKRFEAPAVAVRDAASRAMGAWEVEQKRLADAAARVAQLERERLEAAAKAEADRAQALLTAQAEELALETAVAAEQRGDHALADRIISAPVVAPVVSPRPIFVPPPAVQAAPRLDGVGFRDYYSAKVVDLALLVAAVAAGKAPKNLVEANQVALNAMAVALKESFKGLVPGVDLVTTRKPVNQGGRVD